jgi:hypothetical protein
MANTLGLLWIVPIMATFNISSYQFEIGVGSLSFISLLVTFIDWHTPFWHPESGTLISIPPVIFRNWLTTWSLAAVIMKFPFEIFFITGGSHD